ncbi:hypothetical protein L1887_55539 [Cichorium endivia]|nr:hypothetical protein L1887_55539 [Cichorium endivia]
MRCTALMQSSSSGDRRSCSSSSSASSGGFSLCAKRFAEVPDGAGGAFLRRVGDVDAGVPSTFGCIALRLVLLVGVVQGVFRCSLLVFLVVRELVELVCQVSHAPGASAVRGCLRAVRFRIGDKGGDEDILCSSAVVRNCDVRDGHCPDWSLRCRLPGVEGEGLSAIGRCGGVSVYLLILGVRWTTKSRLARLPCRQWRAGRGVDDRVQGRRRMRLSRRRLCAARAAAFLRQTTDAQDTQRVTIITHCRSARVSLKQGERRGRIAVKRLTSHTHRPHAGLERLLGAAYEQAETGSLASRTRAASPAPARRSCLSRGAAARSKPRVPPAADSGHHLGDAFVVGAAWPDELAFAVVLQERGEAAVFILASRCCCCRFCAGVPPVDLEEQLELRTSSLRGMRPAAGNANNTALHALKAAATDHADHDIAQIAKANVLIALLHPRLQASKRPCVRGSPCSSCRCRGANDLEVSARAQHTLALEDACLVCRLGRSDRKAKHHDGEKAFGERGKARRAKVWP